MGNQPTPLRRAVATNNAKWVETMLDSAGEKASDLINQDHSPDCVMESCSRVEGNAFYYAVSRNRTDIVDIMMKKGADIYSTGIYGETCLHCAVRSSNLTVARLLVENGFKDHIYVTDDRGRYPIHSAAMTIFDTSHIIKYLLEEAGKAEDVNLQDFAGRTPLHEACFMGNEPVVFTLLNSGAEVNAQSKGGNTPLHVAKKRSNVREILLQRGADQNIANNDGLLP